MFRLIKICIFSVSAFIFISCGGWASKERAEFMQECKGGSDKEELISLCGCVYEFIADEFTYEEYKNINELDFNSFSSSDNEKLKRITPDIRECY